MSLKTSPSAADEIGGSDAVLSFEPTESAADATESPSVIFHFPVGDYGYILDPLMGGIGDSEFVSPMYDMREYPTADAGLINVDLGFVS